ncbi:beta-ketoacyl synthase chain length factor [Shewanella avicenniae]|uniref:Beta-ketoacyl synthase chain length factor n=1 Tax=Shewanella avicenniae TaxID=2814294 RepID=A0ABX7QSM8_9GAMM|nr:beta-ketoacyl synthase chain length factor [Shewanella avicenniae]QSX33930.1 beta-ketoacyl synthase chain length factor [Shewanella avicenniae]
MLLQFNIVSWSAWSPAYPQRENWQHWQKASETESLDASAPALTQVPAMQRRRYSRLSKMMLHVAFDTQAPAQCRSVFASRHGELNRTIGLLEDIIAQQPLSPTAFSQSVHNTASGLFGIVCGNQQASTSIAAGRETLAQAMVEAYSQLATKDAPLLLVYGDDPVPPIYDQYTDELEYPLALALLLSPRATADSVALTIETTPTAGADLPRLCYGQLLQALADQQSIQGQIGLQHWQLSAGATHG